MDYVIVRLERFPFEARMPRLSGYRSDSLSNYHEWAVMARAILDFHDIGEYARPVLANSRAIISNHPEALQAKMFFLLTVNEAIREEIQHFQATAIWAYLEDN